MDNQISIKKIALLNRTTLDSLGGNDSFEIIKNFTEAGLKIFEADFGFTWWKTPDQTYYTLAYKSHSTPYEPNLPREKGGNFQALKTRVPFFVENVRKENYEKEFDISPYMKSYVIVPITYKENIYGSLVLCFKNTRIFSDEDRELAVSLGNATAQSITINRLILKEREARLQATRQEEYFRALVENSHEIIALIDKVGHILYVSSSIETICGLKVEEVVGRKPQEFIFNRDDAEVTAYFRQAIDNPHTSQITEYNFKHKNGSMLCFEVTAYNMLDNPNVKGVVLNIRDITSRKNAEILKETERLLREEQRKTEFMTNAAHEIRTPLAIIRGNADVALLEGGEDPRLIRKSLKAIIHEIEHLSDMISDLTLLTAREAVLKEGAIFEEVDLVGILGHTIDRYRTLARKNKIDIKFRRRGQIMLAGNRTYLEKLFINLLKNAVDYGRPGGWVKIDSAVKKDRVVVTVSDNGFGIAATDLPHIFDRFFRADKSHKSNGRNTGLGLSIVKWIVAAHGGTISVESEVNKGTVFEIVLPGVKHA